MNNPYDFDQYYGLTPMTLKDALNAPENIRQTRNDKFNVITQCEKIIKVAAYLMEYARRIPEEDNAEHAKLVHVFAEHVNAALIELSEAQG